MFYVFTPTSKLINWFGSRASADAYADCLTRGAYVRAESELAEHERAAVDRFAVYLARPTFARS